MTKFILIFLLNFVIFVSVCSCLLFMDFSFCQYLLIYLFDITDVKSVR